MPRELTESHKKFQIPPRYVRERDFLAEIIRNEIKERLKDHRRSFDHIGLIAQNPEIWALELGLDATFLLPHEIPASPAPMHDLILHIGRLDLSDDLPRDLALCRKLLRPDGLLLAAFPGGETLVELRHAFLAAEAEIYGGASPHIAPMIDLRDAGALLAMAGFALPVADRVRSSARYESAKALIHDLRAMGLREELSGRRTSLTRRALFDALERHYRARFVDEENRLIASFELIFLTGYAPAPDQPQPLKPGSATMSLAAALEGGNV